MKSKEWREKMFLLFFSLASVRLINLIDLISWSLSTIDDDTSSNHLAYIFLNKL